MRTLHSALLTAQKRASAVPYLEVQIVDKIGGVLRLGWQRLYSGSEPDNYHAATMPGDGSLVRCRVAGGLLYVQRVADPGPGSDFSAWTSITAAADAGVALASDGATVLLFYVPTSGTAILVRESSDYGATFGSPTTVATTASAVGWLAADLKSDGTALLIYSLGADVYAVKRSGGSWGSPALWTNSVASITGLACHYWADFNVVVTGTDSQGNYKVWTTIYGDGYSQTPDTWRHLAEVTAVSSGSSVELRTPFLGYPDVHRLTFVEKYTGSESYSRPYFSYLPPIADYVSDRWREPVPMNVSSEYGLALAFSSSDAWLSTPFGVWQASLTPPTLDVTADVLELTSEDEPGGGRLRLVLRNDDGRYLDLSGQNAVIKPGGEIRVSPGYLTASGPLASDGPAYWIEAWEHTSGEGKATLVLYARDGWRLLEGWRARHQYAWAPGEKSVVQLILFVLARAGLEFASLGTSPAAGSLLPSFTIHPGESGATALRRLLSMVPDVLFFRGHFAYIRNPETSDASQYSYGTDHAIYRGRYGTVRRRANRAQVFGDGAFVDSFDWDSVEATYDRVRQVLDLNLDTIAHAQERADAVLRHEEMASQSGELVVPVNCGQELYDIIDITDAPAGLTAAKRRVVGTGLRYSAEGKRPTYEQRLSLGAV